MRPEDERSRVSSPGSYGVIDTVKLQSPYIAESVAGEIERALVRKSAVHMATGDVLYELFSGQLFDRDHLQSPSSAHGINVRIMRTRFEHVPRSSKMGHPRTKPVMCEPYLWMEGSVHKAMLGHNVWGGPRDLAPSVSWLVSDVSRRLGLELPDFCGWDVMRADWAETYDLQSFENCQDYIRSLNSARFPRREPQRYGDNSLSFPGRTTALRIYHKGPEFLSESFKKLQRHLTLEALDDLTQRAHTTLRVEVSVKRPKITEYHAQDTHPTTIETKFLEQVHEKEVKKLIREANSDMRTVRDFQSVKKRLSTHYAGRERLARSLLNTWVQLATLGENVVKEDMKEWSFYDHRKKLVDAGVAWHGSDVVIIEDRNNIPADFAPVATDPRCTSEEHPDVTEALEEHRKKIA
jgi:II/X family phage/plasmid replication protein